MVEPCGPLSTKLHMLFLWRLNCQATVVGIDRLASAAEVEKFLASATPCRASIRVGLFWKGGR